MVRKICSASKIDLSLPYRRSMPRPVAKRQKDYAELFDHTTFFYDVFRYRDRIVFSGPPLWDLQGHAKDGEFAVGGQKLDVIFEDKWKTQRSFAVFAGNGWELQISSELSQGTFPISPDENELFEGRKVLFTLSRNNKLEWIKDWVEFHVKVHGVDAVLLYDNKSDLYAVSDLLDVLSGIDGIAVAVVTSWPFKYGPSGGSGDRWDSDFCQFSAIEHARRRFLASCCGVINADIDELVVCEDGETIFDSLEKSKVGAVTYAGLWLEPVSDLPQPRHRNFRYWSKKREVAANKWTMVPSALPDDVQANVHDFGSGFKADYLENVRYRHFFGINNDWKYNRSKPIPYDASRHVVDIDYVRVMKTMGWA